MSAALLALALLASSAPARSRPALFLAVYPPQQLAPMRGAAYVRVRVRLDDPGRELHCPEFLIEFGDGCSSSEQAGGTLPWGGCDLLELLEQQPTRYRLRERMHPYREAGVFLVVVTVRAPGRTLRQSSRVAIRGTEEPEP